MEERGREIKLGKLKNEIIFFVFEFEFRQSKQLYLDLESQLDATTMTDRNTNGEIVYTNIRICKLI